jgi:hypothetical protein
MRYTPGPWTYGKSDVDGTTYTIYNDDIGTIAFTCDDVADEDGNANLIAAAPDMLVELKKWHKFMRDNYKPEDITWWHDTEKAIAKAEGR